MARMEVLTVYCDRDSCDNRATREVFTADNQNLGKFCTIHANSELIKQTKAEREGSPKK